MHLNAFKHTREEERYEVGLASGRLASLLASQAFLFTGWAIIHQKDGKDAPKIVLILVPAIAFTICLVALVAIFAAIRVIHRWRLHANRLISEDKAKSNPPELMNFHLDRPPCDWYHTAGVTVFSLAIPVAFMLLWVILFLHAIYL